MADLPPLNALRTFLHAAETQSFKQAAEQLCVTQAAVSHQIRVLEDHLETQLFLRLNREVRLTEDGERLLPYIRSAFRSLRSGVDQLKGDSSPNRLVISVLPSFASRWLVSHLKGFQEEYPDIHLVVKTDTVSGLTDPESCDVRIEFGEGRYDQLRSEFLMRDAMVVVAAPDLIQAGTSLAASELSSYSLLEDISMGSIGWATWLVENDMNPDDFRIALSFQDSGLVIDAALAGQGIALVRKSLAQDFISSGRLVRVSAYELSTPYSYFLVAPEHHFQKTRVKIFAEWIKKELEGSFLPEYFAYYGS